MVFHEDLRQKKQWTARVQVYLFGCLALLLGGFLFYDFFNVREQREAQAQLILQLLAPAALEALEGHHPGLAGAAFSKPGLNPLLLTAVLYNEAGSPVVRHFSSDGPIAEPSPFPPDGFRFDGHILNVMHPLTRGGKTTGWLYLKLSFEKQKNSGRALAFLLSMFVLLAAWGWKSLRDVLSAQTEEPARERGSLTLEGGHAAVQPRLEEPLPETSVGNNPGKGEGPRSAADDESRLWIEYTQVTERMNFEIRMRKRTEEILKTHNRILELLTLGHSLNGVLDQILQNLEKQIGHDAVGVLYRVDKTGGKLDLASAPNLANDFKKEFRTFDLKRGESVFAAAARKNKVVIVEDFEIDSSWAESGQITQQHGVRSVWSVPVTDPTGEVTAVVGMVSKTPGSPGVEELKHIRSAGFIAGMAITRNRYEEAMKNQAKELERSNRDLEEFAGIASHDLQEPLRKIVSFGDQLKKYYADKLDERGNEYLEKMIRGTLRMQQFIGDLLDYSRAGEGSGPLKPTDLGPVLQEVLNDFELQIEEKQARIKVDALPVVPADLVQMRQVFSNLLANSLKFSREGVVPEIEIESLPPKDSQVEIIFRDNGIGFDENYRKLIFKPFERLHPVSLYGGTGIGLALCKKIIDRHGGFIRAESRVGVGTTIHVILPTD